MIFVGLFFLTTALAADHAGGGARIHPRKTARRLRDEAVTVYGETMSPYDVGFILADGRWLDFSEGSGMGRTQDHRHIGHLLEDARGDLEEGLDPTNRTAVMNAWMNRAEAIRVGRSLGRRGEVDYAFLDLPEDAIARTAVLLDLRPVARFLRGVGQVDIVLEEGGRTQRIEAGSVAEALSALDMLRRRALPG